MVARIGDGHQFRALHGRRPAGEQVLLRRENEALEGALEGAYRHHGPDTLPGGDGYQQREDAAEEDGQTVESAAAQHGRQESSDHLRRDVAVEERGQHQAALFRGPVELGFLQTKRLAF